MTDNEMAMVETLPFAHNHSSTFSRFAPLARRSSELMNSPTTLPHNQPSAQHSAPFTLESLAAALSTSPTGGFSYLSGDLYDANSHSYNDRRVPLLKSRSFPHAKRDDPVCVTSPPPLRKTKSVRFADSQGLPLVEAVHQLTCLDSSYTTNKIVPYSDDISSNVHLKTGAKVNCLDKNLKKPAATTNTSNIGSTSSSLPPLTVDTSRPMSLKQCRTSPILKRQNSPTSPVSTTSTHRHRFSFSSPSLEPDFFQRVIRDGVALDSIREEPRSLHGVVRVSNLSYEKNVIIRWTHDNWRTSHDTRAVFCANDGATDRFGFELPINGDDVIFCVRYRTFGKEYWDNNRGQNYTVFSE